MAFINGRGFWILGIQSVLLDPCTTRPRPTAAIELKPDGLGGAALEPVGEAAIDLAPAGTSAQSLEPESEVALEMRPRSISAEEV